MSVLCFQYEQTSLVEQQAERIRNLFGRETAFRNKAMIVELMTSEIEYLFVRMTFRISWKLETWFWIEWISIFLFLDIYTNLHDFPNHMQYPNSIVLIWLAKNTHQHNLMLYIILLSNINSLLLIDPSMLIS